MLRNCLFTAMIALLIFISCAKPSDTTDTRVMLTGKWRISNSLEKKNDLNPPQIINYTGTVSDYMSFERDGNLNCSINGNLQSRKFSILSNEWLKVDADSFRIVQLLADKLTLYRTDHAQLYEYTINLSK